MAQCWTEFQVADEEERKIMLEALRVQEGALARRPRRNRKKPKPKYD